jgi:hypothetical protein
LSSRFKEGEDLDVLFLSETKMDERRLEWFRWKLGMPNMTVRNCEAQGGGLAFFWKRCINLMTRMKSRYHIDSFKMEEDGFQWRFIGIYGEPKLKEREATWKLLRTIQHHSNLPWLCAGDFNKILLSWEKGGGAA